MTTYISDEMRAAIGREYNEQVSYPIGANDIRRWALATYWPETPPALFWDDDYAKTTKFGGIVAPEEFNPFAWISAQPKGLPNRRDATLPQGLRAELGMEGALGIKGPGLEHPLNGGTAAVYGERMRPGDVIRSITRITNYHERTGRLGLMLFTTIESTWTNQQGEMVKISTATTIRY